MEILKMRILALLFIVLCETSGFAQFKNIKLDSAIAGRTHQPCEPTIVINRKNPKNIVAASVLNNVYITEDGGETWKTIALESSHGVAGDPVLLADKKGTLYNFHLSNPGGGDRDSDWIDRIVCQISNDNGLTWSDGSFAGLNPPKHQDKPWATIQPKTRNLYLTWTQFDKYGSSDEAHKSNIMFSESKDGKKWSKPIQINQLSGDCLDDDQTTMGGFPAVVEDRLFVAWSVDNKIFLDRSFNNGATWLTNDIEIAEQHGGWNLSIPGISRSNGLPILIADNSYSQFRGSLYLVYADQKNGETDTDIWFKRSSNFGDNWTTPIRVNDDDGGKHQFLPWMTMDNTTGMIYIVYYDRREYDDLQTDVYLAYSNDGGGTFKNVKISESPFIPTEETFFGDYTNIDADNGIITPIWTRMDDGKTSVMTTIIQQDDLIKRQMPEKKKKKK